MGPRHCELLCSSSFILHDEKWSNLDASNKARSLRSLVEQLGGRILRLVRQAVKKVELAWQLPGSCELAAVNWQLLTGN